MAFPDMWINDAIDAVPRNVTPCQIDIVGNSDFPATAHQFEGDNTTGNVFFRMRLNRKPTMQDDTLLPFVWGVQIKDEFDVVLFTVRIVSSGPPGNMELIQIFDSDDTSQPPIYEELAVMDVNFEVTLAGDNFGCNPQNTNDDYFLAFKVPREPFDFDFNTEVYKFCYFTSTMQLTINGEGQGTDDAPFLCGPLQNEEEFLNVVKTIEGPDPILVNTVGVWDLIIRVENPVGSSGPVNNIEVEDEVIPELSIVTTNPGPPDVIVNNQTVTWDIGTLDVGEMATLTITVTGFFTMVGPTGSFNVGTLTGDEIEPIEFFDTGVLVIDAPPPTTTRGIDLFAEIE